MEKKRLYVKDTSYFFKKHTNDYQKSHNVSHSAVEINLSMFVHFGNVPGARHSLVNTV